jgi:hypothetical protein
MGVPLILAILGIFYAVKRPRIARAAPADYPGVPPHRFWEWQRCELRSIDIFLLATWGQGAVFLVLNLLLLGYAQSSGDAATVQALGSGMMVLQGILFLAGLIASATYGSRAAKLQSEFASSAGDSRVPEGASFLGPSPRSNIWSTVAPILGAVSLVVGCLSIPALVAGGLALQAWKRDPGAASRGRALFALYAGGASLLLYSLVVVWVMTASGPRGGSPVPDLEQGPPPAPLPGGGPGRDASPIPSLRHGQPVLRTGERLILPSGTLIRDTSAGRILYADSLRVIPAGAAEWEYEIVPTDGAQLKIKVRPEALQGVLGLQTADGLSITSDTTVADSGLLWIRQGHRIQHRSGSPAALSLPAPPTPVTVAPRVTGVSGERSALRGRAQPRLQVLSL